MTASSSAWTPPPTSHHLRTFAISLGLVFVALGTLMFGVNLEAITPATGVVLAQDQRELRAPLAGLVEIGWFEDVLAVPGDEPVRVRVDRSGHGLTDPARGPVRSVQLEAQPSRTFHALRPGDVLWPGQVVAAIRPDSHRLQLVHIEERLRQMEERGEAMSSLAPLHLQRGWLREQLTQTVLYVPEFGRSWMALEVRVAQQQAVSPGDALATLVPIDPETKQPCDLIVKLDVEESRSGFIEPGQMVRIYSSMFNHRLHGTATARVESVEPWGREGTNGDRRYHVLAAVEPTPFPLRLGSSCKAEIIVGRKPVYRIILEH